MRAGLTILKLNCLKNIWFFTKTHAQLHEADCGEKPISSETVKTPDMVHIRLWSRWRRKWCTNKRWQPEDIEILRTLVGADKDYCRNMIKCVTTEEAGPPQHFQHAANLLAVMWQCYPLAHWATHCKYDLQRNIMLMRKMASSHRCAHLLQSGFNSKMALKSKQSWV